MNVEKFLSSFMAKRYAFSKLKITAILQREAKISYSEGNTLPEM